MTAMLYLALAILVLVATARGFRGGIFLLALAAGVTWCAGAQASDCFRPIIWSSVQPILACSPAATQIRRRGVPALAIQVARVAGPTQSPASLLVSRLHYLLAVTPIRSRQ